MPTEQELTGEEMIEEALGGIDVNEDTIEDVDDQIVDDDEPIVDETDDDEAAMAKARRGGWKPEEDYTGPPGQWRDHNEFNEVGDKISSRMAGKIDNLEEDNKRQTEMIKKLIASQGTVTRQAHEAAMAELAEKRSDAIYAGNEDAVNTIDKEMKDIRDDAAANDLTVEDEFQPAPETEAWMEKNKAWYDESNASNHPIMDYAAAMENAEVAADPTASLATILDRVTDRVKARYPDRFPNAPRRRSNAVEGGRVKSKGTGVVSFAGYPPEVREMAAHFAATGVMTEVEYLKHLKAEESK